MKYLKYFENSVYDDITKLLAKDFGYKTEWEEYLSIWKDILPEKYILYKGNSNSYFILEILDLESIKNSWDNSHNSIEFNFLPTKRLFIYNKNLNKLTRKKKSHFHLHKRDIKDIIYQSNDLDDIKELVFTIDDSDKYNL